MKINRSTSFNESTIFILKNGKKCESSKLLNNVSIEGYSLKENNTFFNKIKNKKKLLFNNFYRIELEDSNYIEVSNAIFIKDNKEIYLENLKIGDYILTLNGYKRINKIEEIFTEEYISFLDFDFEDIDTFLIANNIFIKNIELSMFSFTYNTKIEKQ